MNRTIGLGFTERNSNCVQEDISIQKIVMVISRDVKNSATCNLHY